MMDFGFPCKIPSDKMKPKQENNDEDVTATQRQLSRFGSNVERMRRVNKFRSRKDSFVYGSFNWYALVAGIEVIRSHGMALVVS